MSFLKIKNGDNQWVDIPGLKGAPGDKPIKGVDYFTESDINELISEILAQLEAPQLFAPGMSKEEQIITIAPSADNGAFDVSFGLYSDDKLINQSKDTEIDLSAFQQPNKFEMLTVRALGQGFLPSEAAGSSYWGYEALKLELNKSILELQNIKLVDIYSIFINGELRLSIPNENNDHLDIIKYDLKDLDLEGGEYNIYAIGWKNGVELTRSNSVVYVSGILEEPDVYVEDHMFRIYDEQAEADTYKVFANGEQVTEVPAMINVTFTSTAPWGWTTGHSTGGIWWEPHLSRDCDYEDPYLYTNEPVTIQVPIGTQFFLENKWTVRSFGDYVEEWGDWDYVLFTCYGDCQFEFVADDGLGGGLGGSVYDVWQ